MTERLAVHASVEQEGLMTKATGRALSGAKRVLIILAILAVGGVTFVICGANPDPGPVGRDMGAVFLGLGNRFAGAICIVLAVAVYGGMYVTNGLTFGYKYPVWNDHKKVVYLAQIAVLALMTIGGGFLLAGPFPSGEEMAGTPPWRIPAAFFGAFVFFQFLLYYVCLWTPVLLRVIRRRLAAKGVSPEDLERGIYMGISDPAKSSLKKMTMVEEDIGMLWLTPEAIVYRGDADDLRVEPAQFLGMTRKADAGSISALAGNVPVLIRFSLGDGKERSVRLHPEKTWTLGQAKAACNALAAAIEQWAAARLAPASVAPAPT